MLFETDLNDEVTGAGSVQQVTTRWRDTPWFSMELIQSQ